jgi:hypothetical protein
MYKLIRMAVFALPLAGGVAWAQASGTSGSAGAPGSAMTPPVTDDTRTPTQQRAGRLDDTAPAPALPGDATKPVDIPNRVEDKATTPDTTDRTAPDTSKTTPDTSKTTPGTSNDTSGMTTPGSGATDETIHKRSTDETQIERKSDTTLDNDRRDSSSKIDDKSNNDVNKDQLDSDK